MQSEGWSGRVLRPRPCRGGRFEGCGAAVYEGGNGHEEQVNRGKLRLREARGHGKSGLQRQPSAGGPPTGGQLARLTTNEMGAGSGT